LHLKKGRQVLTLHFIDQPVMNFDYMEFVPAGQSAAASLEAFRLEPSG